MIQLRMPRTLYQRVIADLGRPHPFAEERAAFLFSRYGRTVEGRLIVLAQKHLSIPDEHYIDDPRYGVLLGSGAFRMAMQEAYSERVGILHVHIHPYTGWPEPSRIDLVEAEKFVPDFFHSRPELPHGAVIFSLDSISGRLWLAESLRPQRINEFRIVGYPTSRIGD